MRWPEVASRYDVVEERVPVGPAEIRLLRVRDINALVDAMGPEDFGPDERLPYWCALWPAARGLARAVLERGPSAGTAIELGAGLGLVSIAAALRGLEVLATDHEPEPLAFAEESAALNGVALRTAQWDWRALETAPARRDLVLASDVVYEARNVAPFAAAADACARAEIWIADPGRKHLPELIAALEDRDFRVESQVSEAITLIRATRRRGLQI